MRRANLPAAMTIFLSGFALAASPLPAFADSSIQIVAATFGKASAAHPFDFSERLQQVCGGASAHCESFCTEAFTGGPRPGISLPFSAPPICRVIYRCGMQATRAIETDKGDSIVLNCRD